MFSGIIQSIGQVLEREQHSDGATIRINASELSSMPRHRLGDSIAVNGVCLTVTALTSSSFYAEISNTTLGITNLKYLQAQHYVNLESALTLNEAVNGHLVSGHVDHVGYLHSIEKNGFSRILTFMIDPGLSQYVIEKGSITLDGISLTVNAIDQNKVTVTIIPHTWTHTIAQYWEIDTEVNVEVDMIARYIHKLSTKSP